jgi:DNA repair protein RadC
MDGALSDPTVETFWVIPVGTKNHPCGRFCVGSGTATACLVHPREVFKPAILASATAVIVVHNHPSGDPSPSSADIRVTRTLREAAEHLQMQLLDHVIIGQPSSRHSGFYSFREAGMI